MLIAFARHALVALVILALASCSAPQKKAKGTSAATTGSPFVASAEKVQKDLGQTGAEFGELESQLKMSR